MDKIEKKLKIYEVWQGIIIQAMKEFYLLDTILLAVFAGIFKFANQNVYLPWIGLLGAIIWYFANLAQLMWKRNWTGRVDRIEDMIIKENSGIFTKNEIKSVMKNKEWNPKFCGIELHLTFILSLFPVIFIILFGTKLNLLNLEWMSSLVSQLCRQVIFLIIVVVLIIKLFQASYCYFSYPSNPSNKDKKKRKKLTWIRKKFCVLCDKIKI